MSKNKNGNNDIEAQIVIIITAFILALLLYIVYGVIERDLEPYGGAAIIGALLGADAIIIAILKIRLKRDEEKEILKQDLQGCKNDLRDSQSTVVEQKENISEKDEEIKSMAKDLDDVKQRFEKINSLNNELEENNRTITNELYSIRDVYENTKKELHETGTKLSDALVQIEACNKKMNELSTSLESLKQDNHKKEQILKLLTIERDKLNDETKRAEDKIIQYKNSIEAIYARVATTLTTGARKIEERHTFRTGLNKDLYIFMIKNTGTSPSYRIQGYYNIHRRVGNPIQIPIEYPAIYEGEFIEFGPTQVHMGIECLRIDVNLEYMDILGKSHRYDSSIPSERIHVERT